MAGNQYVYFLVLVSQFSYISIQMGESIYYERFLFPSFLCCVTAAGYGPFAFKKWTILNKKINGFQTSRFFISTKMMVFTRYPLPYNVDISVTNVYILEISFYLCYCSLFHCKHAVYARCYIYLNCRYSSTIWIFSRNWKNDFAGTYHVGTGFTGLLHEFEAPVLKSCKNL